MTIFFTGTGGNDSTGDGLSWATRWLTIDHAQSNMGSSDLLFVTAGTYAEDITLIPSGTAGAYTQVHNYPGDVVWLKPAAGPAWVIDFQPSPASSYVEFSGIRLDTTNATDADNMGGLSVVGDESHHVRFRNSEILGNRLFGHLDTSRVCVDFNGGFPGSGSVGSNELLDVEIHGSGGDDNSFYGIYIHSSNNIIDGCDIYDVGMIGITCYNSYTDSPESNNNIIRNCRIHDINQAYDTRRIGIQTAGVNTLIYNNLIWNINDDSSGYAYGISLYTSRGAKVYYNTIASNQGESVNILGTQSSVLVGNIYYDNYINTPVLSGANTPAPLQVANLDGIDPLFVDLSGHDFHLTSMSPAIGAGADVSEVISDADAVARIAGSYDCGAFSFNTSPVASGLTLDLTSRTGADVWNVNTLGVFSAPATDGSNARYWNDPGTAYSAITSGGIYIPHFRGGVMKWFSIYFDGADEMIVRNDQDTAYQPTSVLLAVDEKVLLIAFRAVAIVGTSVDPRLNEALVAEAGMRFGVFLRNASGTYKVQIFNDDDASVPIELTISLNTDYVLAVRHHAGVLYASLDGGAESSTASGDTLSLDQPFVIGYNNFSVLGYNGYVGRIQTRSDADASDLDDFTSEWLTAPSSILTMMMEHG